MKVRQWMATVLACAVAQTAAAGTLVDAVQLAGVAAAMEACARVDKRVGARVEEAAESLLRAVSETARTTLRHSADYRSAYSQYVQVFGSLAPDDLARLCADAATSHAPH